MREPSRPAAIVVAGVCLLALASVAVSAAATLGGARAGSLGGAQAGTQRITGVELDWTPVRSGENWGVAGLGITADPGQTFLAGDVVKVAVARAGTAPCEATTTVATDTATLAIGPALAAACPALTLDTIRTVALSITGTDLATDPDSRVGGVGGTLASFSGEVLDPGRSLQAGIGTDVIGGTTYINELFVDVTATGLSPSDLVGTRVLASLYDADTETSFEYSGTISLDPSDPVWASADIGGSRAVTVTLDPLALADRAGTPRARAADVNRLAVVLYAPQHLGSSRADATGRYAISTTAASIDAGSGGTSVTSGLEPVGLDERLTYQHPSASSNDSNGSLSFCHSFTLTNTSAEPVEWMLTFNTSYAPLWGFDPTTPGAFRSAWNWQTVSYDPSTHLWTIRGVEYNRVAQPGQTVGNLGYCVDNVPIPAVDPDTFSGTLSVAPDSSQWWVAFNLTVTSSSQWNVPWEVTVDLADHVCAAGLEGRTPAWGSGVDVVAAHGTVYTLRGVVSQNTRFVAAGKPLTIRSIGAYTPANGAFTLPCAGSATPAASAGRAAPAPSPAPTATASSTAAVPEPSATSLPASVPTATPTATADQTPSTEPVTTESSTPQPTPSATEASDTEASDTGATDAGATDTDGGDE